jgi:hypothetical protein
MLQGDDGLRLRVRPADVHEAKRGGKAARRSLCAATIIGPRSYLFRAKRTVPASSLASSSTRRPSTAPH